MHARVRILLAAEVAVGVMAAGVAVMTSSAGDWHPTALVALLAALAVGSDLLAVYTSRMRLSGAFLAIVLATVLLGPAPAVAIGVVSSLCADIRVKARATAFLNNAVVYALYPLVAGLVVRAVPTMDSHAAASAGFALGVFAVFTLSLIVNFVLIAAHMRVTDGISMREQFRELFVPVLPSELATALLTVGIAYVYVKIGVAAVALLGVVLFTFQYLLGALLVSQERAEELERRSTQLASLQVGVLTAMIQTLSLRDHMTARHSAAVARYSREIAKAAGVPEDEQDLVHTAGLLHDIGKFIFPDSILFADRRLSDEDWEIVKRHPAQGAKVVRQVDGYGPVADIILCHHERIDGTGYPRGLSGEEIPRLARMISIADTYDTMTARESYRRPVSPAEAIAELKRVSGSQLDAELVKVFIEVLASKGVAFQHADDADFEAEVAFERRVKRHAAPRAA